MTTSRERAIEIFRETLDQIIAEDDTVVPVCILFAPYIAGKGILIPDDMSGVGIFWQENIPAPVRRQMLAIAAVAADPDVSVRIPIEGAESA